MYNHMHSSTSPQRGKVTDSSTQMLHTFSLERRKQMCVLWAQGSCWEIVVHFRINQALFCARDIYSNIHKCTTYYNNRCTQQIGVCHCLACIFTPVCTRHKTWHGIESVQPCVKLLALSSPLNKGSADYGYNHYSTTYQGGTSRFHPP